MQEETSSELVSITDRVDAHPPVLHVSGSRQGERRQILWGRTVVALTPKCFKFLAKLAVSAAVAPERWVARNELERGENQARYLYRLEGELESQCNDLPLIWENNRRGAYRLTLPPERITVDWDELERFDDFDLVAWVRQLRPQVADGGRLRIDAASERQAAA